VTVVVTQCPASVRGFRRFQSWQYPGRWTHVPSQQVTAGPRGHERGFVEATGESVDLTIALLPTIAGASSAPAP